MTKFKNIIMILSLAIVFSYVIFLVIEFSKYNPKIHKTKFNKLFKNNETQEIIKILSSENIYLVNYAYVLGYISENKRADCEDILVFCANHKETKVKQFLLGYRHILEPYSDKFKNKIFNILRNDNNQNIKDGAIEYFAKYGMK